MFIALPSYASGSSTFDRPVFTPWASSVSLSLPKRKATRLRLVVHHHRRLAHRRQKRRRRHRRLHGRLLRKICL